MSHRLIARASLIAVWALASLAFAVASAYAAVRFDGETAQGLRMHLRVNDDGLGEVTRAGVHWKAHCGENLNFRSRTAFERPMVVATPEEWREKRHYRLDREGEFRSSVSIRIHGLRVADDRWKGAFRARAEITQHGEHFATCPTGKVKWSATSA